MKITGLGKSGNAKFFQKIMADEFISELFMPDGRFGNRNAWLTITINYRLNFVDSRNPSGVVFQEFGKFMAKDSDQTKFVIKDWSGRAKTNFEKRFREGDKFWNEKFLLGPPSYYTGFDYSAAGEPGFVYCPNVLCLFNLDPAGYPIHLPINVVRANDPTFRSNKRLYDDQDVNSKTLWHELGHALDQLHIKALFGNESCMVDVNADDCYIEPPGVNPNIMGSGKGLLPENAKAWLELIARHTETARASWLVIMNTKIPPKRLPISLRAGHELPLLMNIPGLSR